MADLKVNNHTFFFKGEIVVSTVPELVKKSQEPLLQWSDTEIVFDFSGVSSIDSVGVAFFDDLRVQARARGCTVLYENVPTDIKKSLDLFSLSLWTADPAISDRSFFERIGEGGMRIGHEVMTLLYLISDTAYFSAVGLIRKKGIRRGEFINQCIIIGMNAFPIVALISFLIGFILALQSAAQLRQFGASLYVADLVAISMTREMGPIMTAIVFAGRSGSAIASEIATMVVTEETDALKSMALNPVRFIVVPKMYALSTMMPLLTILSMLIGILGALVIGVTYLDIGMKPFYDQVVQSLILKDIWTGLVKSLVFAWIIGLVGAFQGFRVKGGAEGVGRATTASVVVAIFMVILADSILGLIFYFGQGGY